MCNVLQVFKSTKRSKAKEREREREKKQNLEHFRENAEIKLRLNLLCVMS